MSGEDIKEIRNIVTELKNDPANFHEKPINMAETDAYLGFLSYKLAYGDDNYSLNVPLYVRLTSGISQNSKICYLSLL